MNTFNPKQAFRPSDSQPPAPIGAEGVGYIRHVRGGVIVSPFPQHDTMPIQCGSLAKPARETGAGHTGPSHLPKPVAAGGKALGPEPGSGTVLSESREELLTCEHCGFNCVEIWAVRCPVCLTPTPEVTE